MEVLLIAVLIICAIIFCFGWGVLCLLERNSRKRGVWLVVLSSAAGAGFGIYVYRILDSWPRC